MKTNQTNETTIKSPETITDAEIRQAVGKLAGGHPGHRAIYEIELDEVHCVFTVPRPHGWTTREGQVLETVPDYVNSFDAVLGVINAQSFDTQREVFRHARLYMSPREACLVLLRATGYFNP